MRRALIAAVVGWLAFLSPGARAADVSINLGPSVIALNGPWKFHTGDDPRWATQDFDDSRWESANLTPSRGAHDSDVGLRGYVPGWAARGHRGYFGFARYRMIVSVARSGDPSLWLVGPADVDSAYEVYLNGHLLGGVGDFSRNPPSILAIQPRLFEMPRAWWTPDGARLRGTIAFRVFLPRGPGVTPPAEAGGIHISPLLGNAKGAGDHYRLEWLQTVEGYTVDAVEPLIFLLLAAMALSLMTFDRRHAFYPWLAATLVLLALARANQPIYFLAGFETLREFVLWRLVIVDALTFAAWTIAWSACFRLRDTQWVKVASATLAAAYLVARALGTPVLLPALSGGVIHAYATVLPYLRYAFLLLSAYIFCRGALHHARAKWAALAAMLCGAVGIFGAEVSKLGVPGIWFPFGVGVSLTEYAYVAFDAALVILLLQRLWSFAPDSAAGASNL